MRFVISIAYLLIIVIFSLPSQLLAEGHGGKIGFGIMAGEATPELVMDIWLSKSIKVEPVLSYRYLSSNPGGVSRYKVGAGVLAHWRAMSSTRPYVAFRFALDIMHVDNNFVDIQTIVGLGAEQFFNENFSISGELQLQAIFTDDEISPSSLPAGKTWLQTNSIVSAHFYFN